MAENFVFNAPQFYDFIKNSPGDDDDKYFDYQIQEDPTIFRRSMSASDISFLQKTLKETSFGENFHHDSARQDDITLVETPSEARISEVTEERPKSTVSDRRYVRRPSSLNRENGKRFGSIPQRSISKEYLDRLSQPKKRFGSDQTLNRRELTMAEAVKKFQQTTPERFRSRPKIGMHHPKVGRTIPQGPQLISNTRCRPVHAISHEEQERIDFENEQKFRIKAHPLNKKVLQGPLKPMNPIDKKPTTIPEPFKLTEVRAKVYQSPVKVKLEFHAQPVPDFSKPIPKTVYQKPVTKPQTPDLLKRYQKSVPYKPQPDVQQAIPKESTKLTKTQPLPFSFEARNEALRLKKEQFIKQVYEEEKRAREFHARPAPKTILEPTKIRNGSFNRNSGKHSGLKTRTKSEECLTIEFKAKPATVLQKKPFEPKRDERPLTEISEFFLNTDQRARQREDFEQQLKEKEERRALAIQMEEERRLQQEQEEILKLRKMAEYKAQPIKKYKELTIQPSGKVTEPISPNFQFKKNKGQNSREENKENSE